MEYQIYHSLKGKKKTYIVASSFNDQYELNKYARHYFHCASENVKLQIGYIFEGLLYLDRPNTRKRWRTVLVAHYVR